MSIESVARALQIPEMNPTAKLILIGIANHDGDGGAWPSVATLARYACVSERSVQGWLHTMESTGIISREINAGGDSRTRDDRRPNRYTIHWGISTGVNPVAPRDEERGEAGRADGVKPVSPEPSLNHPDEISTDDLRESAPKWFLEGGYGSKS